MTGDAFMKCLTSFVPALTLGLVLGVSGTRAAECDPVGNVRFICNQVGPEDLAIVPGGEWVLSSGNVANGAVRLINVQDKTTTVLFPNAATRERPDKNTYASCPGPIDPAEKERFRAHGLYLRAGKNKLHKLFVVHHGNRESIEIFELDAHARPPQLTWIGCAVAPEPIELNAVVGLSDGGFITTNFEPRGSAEAGGRVKIMAGENSGELWEWHTSTGWQKIPGTEAAGPNGLELSPDGKTLYIGGWGSQSLIRVSRGRATVNRDTVPLGFRVDNLRWAPDGSLIAAGQGGSDALRTADVATIDPNTLKINKRIRYPYSDVFRGGTTAIQIGNEIWLSSGGGERIAIFTLADLQPAQ
jgi:hypothetical protein